MPLPEGFEPIGTTTIDPETDNRLKMPEGFEPIDTGGEMPEGFEPIGESQPKYGLRADGTTKGAGYFGEIERPDGGISTELSIGVSLDGKETEIPLLVPNLSRQEIDRLMGGEQPSDDIVNKAISHARDRAARGLSPFAQEGEKYDLPQVDPSVVLQNELLKAREGAITMKNFDMPDPRNEQQKQMDQIFTGDDPKVTEYNQIINNMTPEEKEEYYSKYKESFNEQYQEAIKSYEKKQKEKNNVWLNTKKKWNVGKESTQIDIDANDIKNIKDPVEREKELQKLIDKKNKFESNMPDIESHNWVDGTLYQLAEMAPAMVKGQVEGVKVGAPLALGASMLTLGLDPTDLITAPGAFWAGNKAGSFNFWRKQGAGDIYLTMRQEGIDHNYAKPISEVGGALYGAVEFSQLSKAFKGSKVTKKFQSKLIKDSLVRATKEVAKKYAGRVAEETGEEVLQEIIGLSSKYIGSYLDPNKENPEMGEMINELKDRSLETAKQSVSPLAVMSAIGIKGDIGSVKAEAEFTKKSQISKETEAKLLEKGYTKDEITTIRNVKGEGFIQEPEIEEVAKETPYEGEVKKPEGKHQEAEIKQIVTDKTQNQVKINDVWYAHSILKENGIDPFRLKMGEEVKEFSIKRAEKKSPKFYESKAKEYFGETNNFAETGYITEDGTQLDLSGKNQGGLGGTRALDHREIQMVDDDLDLPTFIDQGNIRIMPESGSIDLIKPPTRKQYEKLEEFIELNNGEIVLDMAKTKNDWGKRGYGSTIKEYSKGTSFEEIVNDINKYYTGQAKYQKENKTKAPTFYSKLEKTVETMPRSMPKQDFSNWLDKQGVKQEERDWMGLNEYMQGKDKLSKEEMQAFVKGNAVEIEETTLGTKSTQDIINNIEGKGYSVEDAGGGEYVIRDSNNEVVEDINKLTPYLTNQINLLSVDDRGEMTGASDTKYGQYTLPGGENYREVLFRLPTEQKMYSQNDIESTKENKYGEWEIQLKDKTKFSYPDASTATEAINMFEKDLSRGKISKQDKILNKGLYKSSHYDQPNILAHTRLNDRVDTEGNKVLFIEEIQSDWHQEGRKKGYQSKLSEGQQKELDRLKKELKNIEEKQIIADRKKREVRDSAFKKYKKYSRSALSEVATAEEMAELEEVTDISSDLDDQFRVVQKQINGLDQLQGVPDAPFKKTWHEFVLKKLLREASEKGYDKIAWTTGEMQADRYDLSKQIDEVFYKKLTQNNDSVYDITIIKDKGIILEKENLSISKVEDYLGKDIATKMQVNEGNKTKGGKSGYENGYSLSGIDLKVGGEGMKGFYNQMIPKYLDKYLKKFGGKVEVSEIVTGEKARPGTPDEIGGVKVKSKEKVLSVKITPEMRKAFLEVGQPLFQEKTEAKKAKGLLEIGKARKFLKETYGIDIDRVKGTYEIETKNGGKAGGVYADDLIYIAHLARETTGYHEAFHYLTDKFVDEALYNKALTEVEAEAKKAGVTADEYLAEEFARFKNNKNSVTGTLRQLFNELMAMLKKVFGKQTYANKLFSELNKGRGISMSKALSAVKYQQMPENMRKEAKKYINNVIDKEIEYMYNEVKDYQRGQYRKGKTVGSEFPQWAKDMGLNNEKEALAALKKGNKNYAEARQIAVDRRGKGYIDPQSGMPIPPNPDWVYISDAMSETETDKKQFEEWTSYKPTKEELRKRELAEKRKEVKTLAKREARAKEEAIEERVDRAKAEKELRETKKEKKAIEKETVSATRQLEAKDKALKRLRDKKLTLKQFKTEAIQYAKKLPLRERGKLLAQIKNMNSLLDRAKTIVYIDKLFEDAAVRDLDEKIGKLLKRVAKPLTKGSRKVGKYSYEQNKLFKEVKEFYALKPEEAQKTMDYVINNKESMTEAEFLLKMKMLEYKARGKKYVSVSLITSLHNDLTKMIQLAKDIKDFDTFIAKLNKKENIRKVINAVEGSKFKGNAKNFTTKMLNLYRNSIANTGSMLTSILGKQMGEDLDPEHTEITRDTNIYYANKDAVERGKEIYGIKKDYKFTNKMHDMSEKKYTLTRETKDGDKIDTEVSALDAMDIYNDIKNEKRKEDWYSFYGEENVNKVVDSLSTQDKAFADYMQEVVQGYYPQLNEKHVAQTGRDLGRSESYWPGKSEHSEDFYDDIKRQGETPSFFEEKAKGRVIPIVSNCWLKFSKFVQQAEHVTTLSDTYINLKTAFSNDVVEDRIKKKFGDSVYNTLMEQIELISLDSQMQTLDEVSKLAGKALNNWVSAKVKVSPGVLVKQLLSIGNYTENMPTLAWNKYFFAGLANPKKTLDYMLKNSPYLEARFKRGSSEAIQRALDSAQDIGKKQTWAGSLPSLVQLGDIGAIIFGGYPMVKYYVNQGMSMDEAIKKFEKATVKAQQSGAKSSLSLFQNNKSVWARFFLAFKNTAYQYTRKQVDAFIAYYNGDITKGQLAKTISIYSVIQPLLYGAAGFIVRNLFYGGDDDDPTDDMIAAIAQSPLNAVPIVSDLNSYVVKYILANMNDTRKPWNIFNTPGLSDLERGFKGTVSMIDDFSQGDDVTFEDLLNSMQPFAEMATGAPVGTAKSVYKGAIKHLENIGY